MLKKRIPLVLFTSSLWAAAAWAGAPLSHDEGIKLLSQPGRWIDTDGALQPDGTYLAKEIQIVAHSSADEKEEAAIYGAIEALDRAKGTLRLLGYGVTWDATTTIKDENKRVILSSKLQNGTAVKVQGALQPNGVFKATKIKLQKMKAGSTKPKTKIYGPVNLVDAKRGVFKVLNTTITLRPDALITEDAPVAGGN